MKNYKLILLIGVFIFSFLFLRLIKSIGSSLLFQKRDRISILVYGQTTKYYSLGLYDDINYYLTLSSDIVMKVPGGYGNYRVGALNKLTLLEKKDDLVQKTLSSNISSFLNYYFLPLTNEIYYGSEKNTSVTLPKIIELLTFRSNASFIDRLYLIMLMKKLSVLNFKQVAYIPDQKDSNQLLFPDESFFKKYQGYFYQRKYRIEKKNIQIIYNSSYQTASGMSRMIEGEGVRVVDLTKNSKNAQRCQIIEDLDIFSQTARDLSLFFRCELKKGETSISDIILILGNREKEWEIE